MSQMCLLRPFCPGPFCPGPFCPGVDSRAAPGQIGPFGSRDARAAREAVTTEPGASPV